MPDPKTADSRRVPGNVECPHFIAGAYPLLRKGSTSSLRFGGGESRKCAGPPRTAKCFANKDSRPRCFPQTWVEVSSRKVTIISDVSPRAAEQLIRLNEHGNGDVLNCCEQMLESRVKKIRMSLFLGPVPPLQNGVNKSTAKSEAYPSLRKGSTSSLRFGGGESRKVAGPPCAAKWFLPAVPCYFLPDH